MGLIGKIWADAGLAVDKASFSEYASMLKQSEGQIGEMSTVMQAGLTTALAAPAVAVTGVTAAGIKIASGLQDAGSTLKTLYGDLDVAKEKFQWLGDFAASTPFEFPELLDATVKLKSYGIEAQDYLRVLGDTSSAMGKTLNDSVEALADAQTGEFERLKEFGVKAVEITKKNYEQMGATAEQVGLTALQYTDKYGKAQIKVIDRNNREAITAALVGVDGIFQKYTGAMEERSKTLSGMWSNLTDNLSMGLADLMGFKDMEVQTLSLMSILSGLLAIAVDVSGALSGMSEPMQTFVIVAALGGAAALALGGGFVAASAAGITAAAVTTALSVAVHTVLWPATLVVGVLALVAAGLVYLNEKTGLVSAAWQTLKDVFTITAYHAGQVVGWLHDWVVQKIDGIKTAINEIVPESWVNGITTVWNTVTSAIGGAGDSIHQEAEQIRTDHNNIGTSADSAKNVVVGALGQMQTGYGVTGASAEQMGITTDAATNQVITGNNAAGQSALGLGANTKTATDQMSSGFIRVTETAGPMVLSINSAVSPVDVLKATISDATGANYAYSASFIDVSNKASDAASAAISAADRIGAAIKTNIAQVGEIEALAGKWNTRAKVGVTSRGGAGKGEGNVKIITPANMMTPSEYNSRVANRNVYNNNVKINTINNNGNSVSKSSIRAVS